MKKLSGLIAAAFTPFESGKVNLDLVPAYSKYLTANGVSGVFINGTTGESHSLTVDERLRLAERWLEAAPPELQVIVHVGHNSLPECCEMSRHARENGAWAVSAMAPSFFKPSLSELIDFVGEIAGAAPDRPFYYYHMPSMTGLPYRMIDFLQEAEGRIPNLAGIKFTYEDLMDYALCVAYADGKFDMVFGRDEMLVCGLTLGGKAAIGSTYNFAAPLYLELMDAVERGDLAEARRLQVDSMQLVAACLRASPGCLPAIRVLTEWRSDLDFGPMRAPITPLNAERANALRSEAETLASSALLSLPATGPIPAVSADGLATRP